MKKLKKSSKNKVIFGIFGGLGEYFEVDPTLLRLIGLFLFIYSGFIPFVLVYLVAVMVVPKTEEQLKIDAQKPAYKKGWFWALLMLFVVFVLIPILGFVIFRFNSSTIQETDFQEIITESMNELNTDYLIEEGIDIK